VIASAVLAVLEWDITVRGIIFPAVMFLILVGATYVILATNVGNRLGFLLANAAFWGWMTLMTVAWMIYGIGLKGNPPSWKVQEVITNVGNAQSDKVATLGKAEGKVLPRGWKEVAEGTPTRGEAQSATDAFLIEEKVFSSSAAYQHLDGFETGGAQRIKIRPRLESGGSWWNPGDYRFMGLLHQKRFYVDRLAPFKLDAAKQEVLGPDKKPIVDTAKTVNVVMVRNLGNKRMPAFKVFLASLILLTISTRALHARDKQVMSAMKTRPKTA
jgi:hypothetical protein